MSNSKTKEFRGEFKAQILLKRFEEFQGEIKQAFELLSNDDDKQEIDAHILSKKSKLIFQFFN